MAPLRQPLLNNGRDLETVPCGRNAGKQRIDGWQNPHHQLRQSKVRRLPAKEDGRQSLVEQPEHLEPLGIWIEVKAPARHDLESLRKRVARRRVDEVCRRQEQELVAPGESEVRIL